MKNTQFRTPDEEALIQTAQDFLTNEKYDELLTWVDALLETGEHDLFYRIRAMGRVYKADRLWDFQEDLLLALDDADRAISIEYSEVNLRLKDWVFESASSYESTRNPDFEYSIDHIQDEINWRYRGNTETLYPNWRCLLSCGKENMRARIDVLSQLIELTHKPEYYEKRAKTYSSGIEALSDIKTCIDLEPTHQRYMIKADIETASGRFVEAMASIDLAYANGATQVECLSKQYSIYKQSNKPTDALAVLDQLINLDKNPEKHLNEKFLLLYDQSAYKEALITLDNTIALFPPKSVNGTEVFYGGVKSSYSRKLDVLLRLEDYQAYAMFIKSLMGKDLQLALIYYLSILIEKKQYQILLDHFQSEQDNSHVVKWFVICALIGLDETVKASDLILKVNFSEVYDASESSYNIWNRDRMLELHQLQKDDNIRMLIESLHLDRMSFLLLFELVGSISMGDFHMFPLEDNEKQTVKWYTDYELSNLPDVRRMASELKIQRSRLDGSDRLSAELRAKQRLVVNIWHHLEKFPTGAEALLVGIERELTRIIDIQSARKIDDAKIEERNRILSSLSHSIKNTLRSIIDPLIVLKREIPQKERLLSDAIKGAGLIREMVTAIDTSTDAKLEDTLWDIEHPNEESMSLKEMICRSLNTSLGNMFDSRNYAPQHEKYFPRRLTKGEYADICSEWEVAVSAELIQPVLDFAALYMVNITLDLSPAAKYVVGNQKGSAIKLLILFQEIIFNAVKYTSDREIGNRSIMIALGQTHDRLIFKVENSYDPGRLPKTTGIGGILIDNFARVLATQAEVSRTDSVYCVRLEFDNLWRKHDQEN